MSARLEFRRSIVSDSVYGLLNPIPFGCFVAAMIFDFIYSDSAVVQWNKSAAWLVVFGLLFAVVPRLLNLTRVWITARATSTRSDKLDFWLNLIAIVAAIINAFVHSRDAYAVVPEGLWLSVGTVVLLSISHVIAATQRTAFGGFARE
jgi:uncharacterized membrane protein